MARSSETRSWRLRTWPRLRLGVLTGAVFVVAGPALLASRVGGELHLDELLERELAALDD